MRIGIDARFLTHPQKGGFKTYTENLIRALSQIDLENEYFLYLDRQPETTLKWSDCRNFTYKVLPGDSAVIGMPWREQVHLVFQSKRDKLDLLHSPCLSAPLFLSCPLVVTIHDVIWLFPNKFSKGVTKPAKRTWMEWYYYFLPQFAARSAAVVLTVSQSAKQDIVKHLGTQDDRIVITPEAAGDLYRRIENPKIIEDVRLKYKLPCRYILAIGSADPRKNMRRLVQSYALLSTELQEKNFLVIVWTNLLFAKEMSALVAELQLTTRVIFLQKIPDEDLVLLYNAARLFVFPSLYEGFGLPLLEAMASGTPVVAADNSSIPEVVGDAAVLVDAEKVEHIAREITHVLVNENFRDALIQKGFQRVQSFSWENCARLTLHGYEQAFRTRSSIQGVN
jgi:glycosyltransferase involved in cell wall biosynthesis